MNTDIRTLKLVVDALRERHDFLSAIAIQTRLEAASEATVSELDLEVDPAAVTNRLRETLEDEEFVGRIDELANDDQQAVDEPELLASAIARRVGESADDASVDWAAVAGTFIESLQRNLAADIGETPSLRAMGIDALREGAFESAEAYLRVSLDLAREREDQSSAANSLVGLGHLAMQRGKLDSAETHYEEGLDIARGIDARSTEADCIAGLGSVATSRGAYELAETYLHESLDIKRLVDDPSGEATALASLGDLAADRGDYETANSRYAEALPLFVECGDTSERVQTRRCLVESEINRGNHDAAIEHCGETLALFDDGAFSAADGTDRWFRTTHARLTGDAEAVDSLYAEALAHIRKGDDPAAFELLDGLWDCREAFESGTEPYTRCLCAGVALAAYHLLLETDSIPVAQRAIVDGIEDHREALSEPAERLFAFVKSEGADRDLDIDTGGVDAADPTLDDLERLTYAEFLARISETPPPSELYSSVLQGIVSGELSPTEIVERCLVAVEHEAAADDSRAVLGARLSMEAYRERFEYQLPTSRAESFKRIDANQEALSEPLAALFEQLSTGSSATTPEMLVDAADRVDPSLVDIERLAVARLLDGLQD